MLISVGTRTVQMIPVMRDISAAITTMPMGPADLVRQALYIQRNVTYGDSETEVPRSVRTSAFQEHAASVAIVHRLLKYSFSAILTIWKRKKEVRIPQVSVRNAPG